MPSVVLDLDHPDAWPSDLRTFLDANYDLLLGWEIGTNRPDGRTYDRAIYGLIDILKPYSIRGWHCTRLTDTEVEAILANGMQLPDRAVLGQRIDALVAAGNIEAEIAQRLKTENQADDQNRRGMLWFCFFHPRLGGESGICRFFRHWGGEALYNSHEDDPITSPILSRIGVPCLVEADVPIASFGSPEGMAFNLVRRYLVSRGYKTTEPVLHENRAKSPLGSSQIRRIIRFSNEEFSALTDSSGWRRSLD